MGSLDSDARACVDLLSTRPPPDAKQVLVAVAVLPGRAMSTLSDGELVKLSEMLREAAVEVVTPDARLRLTDLPLGADEFLK